MIMNDYKEQTVWKKAMEPADESCSLTKAEVFNALVLCGECMETLSSNVKHPKRVQTAPPTAEETL